MSDKPEQPTSDSTAPGTDDRLLKQARVAADQAIELAKLAQESAKLAQDLNRRAMGESGQALDDLPEVTLRSHGQTNSEVIPQNAAPVVEPPVPQPGRPATRIAPSKKRRNGKANSREALKRRVEKARRQKVKGTLPKKVKIKVRKGDLDREAGFVPFVRRNWNSMTFSGVVIAIVLFLLTFYIMPVIAEEKLNTVIASFSDEEAPVEEDVPVEQPDEESGEQLEEEVEEPEPDPEPEPEDMPEPEEEPEPEMAEEPPPEEVINPESTDEPVVPAEPSIDFAKEGTRSENAKKVLLAKYGGTAASESAVGNALEWFARHQRRDGSWNFNDVGASGNAGSVDNPMAATSYVLLAYLGAGQTHKSGKYKKNVEAGLNFIMKYGRRVDRKVIDFSGLPPDDNETHERFYSHGAASMALTEAYSMTKARLLKPYAEGAVNALVLSQDSKGGGWEYVPYQPGTTSVTGLQVTALMSAKKARLQVPKRTFQLASHFFDTVQSDDTGTRYGYRAAKPTYKSSVTAIAILCRQYLGWERDDPTHIKAIKLLDDKGPASDSLYYRYYATQAMRNYGGEAWERWNEFNRDELCERQETEGDAKGSWPTRNRALEAKGGGRLFMTVLSTLTLEVYYRYLPLYENEAAQTKSSEKE
ncbi:MAG: prenyltransferase/squalene oxidase repeat-containing protein [Planctomycetaceae bacterium]